MLHPLAQKQNVRRWVLTSQNIERLWMTSCSSTEEGPDSLDACHRQEIERGLEDAREGRLLDYEEVKNAWLKRLEQQ